jgi:hypothetical protein
MNEKQIFTLCEFFAAAVLAPFIMTGQHERIYNAIKKAFK